MIPAHVIIVAGGPPSPVQDQHGHILTSGGQLDGGK